MHDTLVCDYGTHEFASLDKLHCSKIRPPFPVQVDYREGSTFNVAAHLPAFLHDIVQVRLNALRGVYRIGINPSR